MITTINVGVVKVDSDIGDQTQITLNQCFLLCHCYSVGLLTCIHCIVQYIKTINCNLKNCHRVDSTPVSQSQQIKALTMVVLDVVI